MDTKSNDDSGSDSLDKSMQSKCVMVDTTSAASSVSAAGTDDCSRDSAALRETPTPPSEPKTEESNTNSSSNNNNNNISSESAAFESKVKLISQNLKETTLAETETSASIDAATGAEEPNSTDDSDQRVKKVRFHPDVKENDGGNRVKKKQRSPRSDTNHSCDSMDLDEDDDDDVDEEEDAFENDEQDQDQQQEEIEQEEEFNLAKTIAEAEDYLKQHPLTFVRRIEQNGERMRDGLHNIEEMPQPQMHHRRLRKEHDNEDNFYKRTRPENGIERILGKETKDGKVEFLLRYENQGGLFWESEEYIRRMCPALLKSYEKNRERRQQRLMHHVAKRQTMRQRYTDF